MRVVVAIHDPPIWTIPAREVERIAAALPEDEVVDARTPEERLRAIPTAEVLLTTRLSAEEWAAASRLKWIQTSAVGVGGLLRPGVPASEVTLTNARGVHADAIAEHAVALVLALRRGLHTAVRRQAERVWAQVEFRQRAVEPLWNTALLVVGLGAIGSRVAAMGAALGMRVAGIRRRVGEPTPAGVREVLPPGRLREALAGADAVVLAAARTEETRMMIGRGELAVMRPSAILVNVARGRLVDEAALAEALATGRLRAAGLDAFTREPLADDSPLWGLPGALLTPHVAAFAGDYWAPVVDLFLNNMRRFRRGETLLNVVDKTRGY